jgi:hypothetical protein
VAPSPRSPFPAGTARLRASERGAGTSLAHGDRAATAGACPPVSTAPALTRAALAFW